MTDLFSLKSYEYSLPPELIAKHPVVPRDSSRLMIINRTSGEISEVRFCDIVDLLQQGDSLVFNDAKVIPARLLGTRKAGGATEILLVRRITDELWEAIGRPGRKLRKGTTVRFSDSLACEIVEELEGPCRMVKLRWTGDLEQQLQAFGQLPLPPYLGRPYDPARDPTDYQTVVAKRMGAVAAPTAALHFTQPLLDKISAKGVDRHTVTLDVSLGTFQPVQVEDIRLHPIHTERYHLDAPTADVLRQHALNARQICVGTTCCRVLESIAAQGYPPGDHETSIFIYPGYRFRHVKTMLTNFHAPASTLLMLVSAFAGYELIQEAYAKAIERKFRFLSYGDGMLIT